MVFSAEEPASIIHEVLDSCAKEVAHLLLASTCDNIRSYGGYHSIHRNKGDAI